MGRSTPDWVDTLFDSDGDNTAQACKASPGYLRYIEVYNINGADAFLQLFDVVAASVTVGTTTPKQTFLVPKGNGGNYGALGLHFDPPIKFDAAITYACTNTPTGAGDPTTGLTVNLGFI